jgi:hypothetical protein
MERVWLDSNQAGTARFGGRIAANIAKLPELLLKAAHCAISIKKTPAFTAEVPYTQTNCALGVRPEWRKRPTRC